MDDNKVEDAVIAPESDERRQAIAAAFEATELPVVERVVTEEPKADAEAAVTEPKVVEAAKSTETPTESRPVAVDRAPQSWKPAQKAKWDTLDPEIRQEVIRRERETTQVLNETASARQLASQLQQTVQPYMARIQSLGAQPMAAVGELLKSDHILSSAPPQQRAQFMAKLINDYGIDIQALDAALAGKAQPDSVDTRVEQLLQQRLAPFNSYLQQQQQREAFEQSRAAAAMEATVEQMHADATKYPHFEEVRNVMADVIEINSKRGKHLSLEQAYNTAVAMDPTYSQSVAAQVRTEQATQLNSKAQRALQASLSVAGAPSGSTGKKPDANDRRAIIEAAFDSAAGR
jgi:hypothetical protein